MQYFKNNMMSAMRPVATTARPKIATTPNPTQIEKQKIRALRLRSEFAQIHGQSRPSGVFASLYS